jgi:hypothetical protein
MGANDFSMMACGGKLCRQKVKKNVNFIKKGLQRLTNFLPYIILYQDIAKSSK